MNRKYYKTTLLSLKVRVLALLFFSFNYGFAQTYFNAWLSTCSHLIGPTGNPNTLKLAVDQSRGMMEDAPGFSWDILIDVGDWTASQAPPDHEEGAALAKCLNSTLGKDRGVFFTVSGNHDGEQKGWQPGEFTQKYVNPLGEAEFSKTAGFDAGQRPDQKDYRQLLDYPGTRWDRYLIRTGNVIWIMLGDRNEFDRLAEARGDTTGTYQAGRGSASGMPKGGYPSGSVTLDTFEWWKKVIEDPAFHDDIFMTAHHLLPANTTISTDDGEPGNYHGKSGSVGPNGKIGGQLYWIREYNAQGEEINQYAQTRPFLNYLQDHPGAIAAWIGGHSHIGDPEAVINGRGIHVRKYGVTFISVGALTDSHAGGNNQMTRMLTFENGKEEAIVNVYVHQSKDGHSIGWYEPVARSVPLGKKFVCPEISSNIKSPVESDNITVVPDAPEEPLKPRYSWNLNEDHDYDFNNKTYVIGEDGSPYGKYEGINKPHYSDDTPLGTGRSLDLRNTEGRINFGVPFIPEMNWGKMTMSIWIKCAGWEPQEVISYGAREKAGKFKLWYDGTAWNWEVGEGKKWQVARWETKDTNNGKDWHHFIAMVDNERDRIQLYVDGKLVAENHWFSPTLNPVKNASLVIGAQKADTFDEPRSYNGWIDDFIIYDKIVYPSAMYPAFYKN